MGLFSELLKVGIKNKEEYIDITDDFSIEKSSRINSHVNIDTDVEIHILRSDDECAHINIFSTKKIASNSIGVDVQSNEINTNFVISGVCDLRSCFINICLPVVNSLNILAKNADIQLKNCCVDNCCVTTKNGEILIDGTTFSEMDLITKNADINVFLNKGSIFYDLKSKCGDVMVEKVRSKSTSNRKLKCFSDSGDILLKYADE